ncbi:microcystin dependent protein [Dyella lipolytica]|uniref:Phage tail protein n=1 Tax=Dyella lipolytica TaxID=1867835 RepID=A0ABW8IQ85_9GAMM|nr:tail fiber protein [Dyella lipolytica]GLQ45168.1 microcystin dependent protein [Dyella lipolytica]
MSEYFIGQIMLTGFNFAQRGFALCNGQTLPINQNAALFSLIGTYYGGNGVSTFCLPDLRGRTPMGAGNSVDPGWQPPGYQIGQQFGVENVVLDPTTLPQHAHIINATTVAGKDRNPTNTIYGVPSSESIYGNGGSGVTALAASQLQAAGGSQPHSNMQPYRVINFNIALTGVFPSRN